MERGRVIAAAIVAIGMGFALTACDPYGTTVRASVSSSGAQVAAPTTSAAVSGDGRFVLFTSQANDLVPNDPKRGTYPFEQADAFVFNRVTKRTEMVSIATDGTTANQPATALRISRDGRWVAFSSEATNLGSGTGSTLRRRIYLRDRTNGTTTMVLKQTTSGPVAISSIEGLSDDGATMLINGTPTATLVDVATGATTPVGLGVGGSVPDEGPSGSLALSGDGQHVAFKSRASNLVEGDVIGTVDQYVWDRDTGATTLVTPPALSTKVPGSGPTMGNPSISDDGTRIVFERESDAIPITDGVTIYQDAYLWERATSEVRKVTPQLGGPIQPGPAIQRTTLSGDGRWLIGSAYEPAPAGTAMPLIVWSVDDPTNRKTVTISNTGTLADRPGDSPSISDDGTTAAFLSSATNLVPNDTNGVTDAFVWLRPST